jgi:hypothetical protein
MMRASEVDDSLSQNSPARPLLQLHRPSTHWPSLAHSVPSHTQPAPPNTTPFVAEPRVLVRVRVRWCVCVCGVYGS